WGASNFLVRTRSKFAAHDLMVAVMDAPSDHQDELNPHFRMSREHSAVTKHLRGRANVPVWLVGTSMGTFSAANRTIGATDVTPPRCSHADAPTGATALANRDVPRNRRVCRGAWLAPRQRPSIAWV